MFVARVLTPHAQFGHTWFLFLCWGARALEGAVLLAAGAYRLHPNDAFRQAQ